MIDDFPRDTPLRKCPHAACTRGRKTCQKLSFKGACVKTHFATYDEWAQWMADRIFAFVAKNARPLDPYEPRMSDAEAGARMYRALQNRLAQGEADEAAAKQRNVH